MDRKLMRKFSLDMRQSVLMLAKNDVEPHAAFSDITDRAEAYLKWINENNRLPADQSYEILIHARVYGLSTEEVLRNATLHRNWLTKPETEV